VARRSYLLGLRRLSRGLRQMRAAAQSLPIRQPDIHALSNLRMLQARVPAALLACAAGLVLGPPSRNAFHPWGSSPKRWRIGVIASSRAPRRPRSLAIPRRPNQSVRPLNRRELGLASPARSSRPLSAAKIARHFARADHVDRAPLMRFESLQHIRPRVHCPGLPASGRSRFGLG